jgi:hypothetical protein
VEKFIFYSASWTKGYSLNTLKNNGKGYTYHWLSVVVPLFFEKK